MRILFNHGLTPAELYAGTKPSVINRKWRWFIARYGYSDTYEDAIADPFKYCFGLIINKIIDERVRFVIPNATEAFIDFEIVTGEFFEKHKQNGRFSEIDFIESDFTGYFLRYYFKARSYQKSYPIYLGGPLKQKFLNGINSGVKYYTVRDVTLADFLDDVRLKFPELTKAEIKKLLTHGFRRMHSSMLFGCAISITTHKYIECCAHIGELSLDPVKQMKQYGVRRDRKLRKIEMWKKTPFDGYYYIVLNPPRFIEWAETNKKARTIVKFVNVISRKIQRELYYRVKQGHIFRFKVDKFKGWAFWSTELSIRKLEYMGEAYEHKFVPSDKTWKQLIKEYEKGQ